MEPEILEINVCDTVEIGDFYIAQPRKIKEVRSPYFYHGLKFTENKDSGWAPARSRAPSVTIEFDLIEGDSL